MKLLSYTPSNPLLILLNQCVQEDEEHGFPVAKKLLDYTIPYGIPTEELLFKIAQQFKLSEAKYDKELLTFNSLCCTAAYQDTFFEWQVLPKPSGKELETEPIWDFYQRALLSTWLLYCTAEAECFRKRSAWHIYEYIEIDDEETLGYLNDYGFTLRNVRTQFSAVKNFIWHASSIYSVALRLIYETDHLLNFHFLERSPGNSYCTEKEIAIATLLAAKAHIDTLSSTKMLATKAFERRFYRWRKDELVLKEDYDTHRKGTAREFAHQAKNIDPIGVFQYSEYHRPFRPIKSYRATSKGYDKATQDRF